MEERSTKTVIYRKSAFKSVWCQEKFSILIAIDVIISQLGSIQVQDIENDSWLNELGENWN